jgi:hypothetical protein
MQDAARIHALALVGAQEGGASESPGSRAPEPATLRQ